MNLFPHYQEPSRAAFPHPFPDSPMNFPQIIPFHGKTTGVLHKYIIGQLHYLPPQPGCSGGFSGFQRISFIRYKKDPFGVPVLANGFYTIFEGVVLPGGLMILGRF